MRTLLLFSSLILTTLSSIGQSTHLGVFGGASNYQGDLLDRPYKQTKGAVGITATREISDRFSLRAGLTFAKVAGSDRTSNKDYLRARNFDFQSRITEFSLLGELNTFNLYNIRWTPYFFGGLALFHFDPYSYTPEGRQVYLQPLSTEGQGLEGYNTKPYAKTQLSIPFGGGFKYAFSDNVRLGLEVGMRKLFTDHLDDISGSFADAADLQAARGDLAVQMAYRADELPGGDPTYPQKGSQRGNAAYKDWYYFSGLHLTFRLNNKGGGGNYGPGRKKGFGCPTVPY